MAKHLLLVAVVGMLLGGGTLCGEDAVTREQLEFFESKVRPILVEHCVECHGIDKQQGGLRLDSRSGLLAGGESGPAIDGDEREASLILAAINYEMLEMPPTGKLDEQQIAVLTEWVLSGAPWPITAHAGPHLRARNASLTDEDRAYWAFQPLSAASPPVPEDSWARNPIDGFILTRLRDAGLEPSPPADKIALIRRAYFDLWGIPPTPEEIDAFLSDTRPNAFARWVDRLLEHPNYGRRWARHWLDLVRYAESDGYKQDGYRPNAWRYRDYVIKSFNEDKPYDQFVMEQLAGDEIAPHDLDALTATGFLRHTIYEYNQRDVRSQWDLMLNEVTDVTADVFLGIGLSCARCHDHKFDPFLQEDYYRLRAFFEPILPRDDVPHAPSEEILTYQQKLQAWEEKTQDIRAQLELLEQPIRQQVIDAAVSKFPLDIRPLLSKPAEQRTPGEQQLAELANRQTLLEVEKLDYAAKLSDADKARWEILRLELAAYESEKPAPLAMVFCVTDVGPQSPPTYVPGRGDQPIAPGILSVLDPAPMAITPPAQTSSTGRRMALAQWIAHPENPLTSRVIVNRVWQYHFGTGLVASSSDFGRLGEPPSHPELLDWLAGQLIAQNWSLKSLHRLIMNSATYQQSSQAADWNRGQAIDPRNRLLWHMPVRRLDAEQIRDSLLAVSGELREHCGGPSASSDVPVRSIFTRVMRNTRDPLLEAFDAPDAFSSLAQRNVTTTPTQSLLMINSPITLDRATALARIICEHQRGSTDPGAGIQLAYRRTLGRFPDPYEVEVARTFLEQQRLLLANANADGADAESDREVALWTDFCHVLLNSSEFLYVE